MEKSLDLICIGRVAVDLYGEQIGSSLEKMTSFAKYLGGSSGNLAFGAAKQGLKVGMVSRVGDEHMGRFIRDTLAQQGVDTKFLNTDKDRLTGLVLLGIKDQDTFPLIFYRENCADMGLTVDDINEDYIASCRCLAITGTHLSHPSTRAAVEQALIYAKRHQVKTVLDIDYRPVLWGLTGRGEGDNRYVASNEVTASLQTMLSYFDLIVGTEEEFLIVGGEQDILAALSVTRSLTKAELVCKRGSLGCCVFTDEIPDTFETALLFKGVAVDVLNVLGAGDAFLSGLLRGYIRDEGWAKSCRYANACGALVVSRHGCAPAMPNQAELDYYLDNEDEIPRPDTNAHLIHLHRVQQRTQYAHQLAILAFDHRLQLVEMAAEHGADFSRIHELKALIWRAISDISPDKCESIQFGIICDDTYGQSILNAATDFSTPYFIARPIEQPASIPITLEQGDLGTQLRTWPANHVVKSLIYYHPDDEDWLKAQQKATLGDIYHACVCSGHEWLLELILPKRDAVTSASSNGYVSVMHEFYDMGLKPDWWKLPPQPAKIWRELVTIIKKNDPDCQGILILGLDAPDTELIEAFQQAKGIDLIRGFAVGRTLFAAPSAQWFSHKLTEKEFVAQVKMNYLKMMYAWQQVST